MKTKVVLSIPKLVVTGGYERNKEIYVIGITVDENHTKGEGQSREASKIVSAYNETLSRVAPNILNGVQDSAHIAVSNIFMRVQENRPISLTGSGILLYPYMEPGSFMHTFFTVVECDSDTRNLGKVLEDAFEPAKTDILMNLNPTSAIISSTMNGLISVLHNALTNNKDDIYLTHCHSGFDFDNYGLGGSPIEDVREESFNVENDRISLSLKIRVEQIED